MIIIIECKPTYANIKQAANMVASDIEDYSWQAALLDIDHAQQLIVNLHSEEIKKNLLDDLRYIKREAQNIIDRTDVCFKQQAHLKAEITEHDEKDLVQFAKNFVFCIDLIKGYLPKSN